jgi:hypothetical protein
MYRLNVRVSSDFVLFIDKKRSIGLVSGCKSQKYPKDEESHEGDDQNIGKDLFLDLHHSCCLTPFIYGLHLA